MTQNPQGTRTRRFSIPFLTGILGGLAVGVLATQAFVGTGHPERQALPNDPTLARVFPERVPMQTTSGTLMLSRYYAQARQASEAPETSKPAPAKAVWRGVTTTPVEPVVSPRPAYPLLAERVGAQGTVDVVVAVDAEGFPATLTSSNGNKILQQAALDAATDWRFRPATVNGKPVPGLFHIQFDFRIPPGRTRL